MLVEYFAQRLDEQARRWDAERAKIHTPADLTLRNRFVREKVREMMGPLPTRPALNARVVRKIERAGYRIENVVFQSRPDYWIPANVYVPVSSLSRYPAVVIQRGHFNAERMSPDYQQMYFDLAMNGFVVLAFDPVGQGERHQFYEPGGEAFEESLSPTLEHGALGGLLSLIGETAASYFLWDGMRAIDYLVSRPDVERGQIGVADHTDTGESALLLALLDDRVQCAALHMHGKGRQWPLDKQTWNTTEDPEQQLFPAATFGIDTLDLLKAVTPKPLLGLVENQAGEFDLSAASLNASYVLLGAGSKFAVEKAKPGPNWPTDLRVAGVRWFRRWLANRPGEVHENDVTPEPFTALHVTEKGSLRESPIGQSVYAIIRSHAANLPPRREATPIGFALLQKEIRELLPLPATRGPVQERDLSTVRLEGYWLSRVEFLSEPGIYISAQVYRPNQANGECAIYLAGNVTQLVSVNDDGPPDPQAEPDIGDPSYDFARPLVRNGTTVVVADVRGLGLTQPVAPRRDYRGQYEHLHNSDVALANMAWTLGDSLFGMRVRDVLRAVDYGSQFGRVRLAGADMGALWALYAAALEPRVASVAIQHGLISYRSITDHGRYMQATSQFLPGVLKHFDLPHVAGLIAPRKLVILDPVDHMEDEVESAAAEQAYEWTRLAYASSGAPNQFKIAYAEDLAGNLA